MCTNRCVPFRDIIFNDKIQFQIKVYTKCKHNQKIVECPECACDGTFANKFWWKFNICLLFIRWMATDGQQQASAANYSSKMLLEWYIFNLFPMFNYWNEFACRYESYSKNNHLSPLSFEFTNAKCGLRNWELVDMRI